MLFYKALAATTLLPHPRLPKIVWHRRRCIATIVAPKTLMTATLDCWNHVLRPREIAWHHCNSTILFCLAIAATIQPLFLPPNRYITIFSFCPFEQTALDFKRQTAADSSSSLLTGSDQLTMYISTNHRSTFTIYDRDMAPVKYSTNCALMCHSNTRFRNYSTFILEQHMFHWLQSVSPCCNLKLAG